MVLKGKMFLYSLSLIQSSKFYKQTHTGVLLQKFSANMQQVTGEDPRGNKTLETHAND